MRYQVLMEPLVVEGKGKCMPARDYHAFRDIQLRYPHARRALRCALWWSFVAQWYNVYLTVHDTCDLFDGGVTPCVAHV